MMRNFIAKQVADRLLETGGLLGEEVRLVTSVFADLSGFTALAERLDTEELLEVVDPVIAELSNVVGRYDGYVDKYAGDAVLALFGAPTSHDDDPARALLAALEMHRAVASAAPHLPCHVEKLFLHVGVNSGHVVARVLNSDVRTDYSVLGDAVNLAQRLQAAAPPGETYVGDTTRRLTQDRFDFEPLGELDLKGKSTCGRAWRLVGPTSRTSSRRDSDRPALVGRQRELQGFEVLSRRLADGLGGVCAVIGEPGVGKTVLTQQARERALLTGILWIEARCLSYGHGLPYWPYRELLRQLSGADNTMTGDQVVARLLEAAGTAASDVSWAPLRRVLWAPSSETARVEPEAFRRSLHVNMTVLMSVLARQRPIALAIEDAQWLDAASLALTAELARRAHEIPLLLYLTGRPEARASLTGLCSGDIGESSVIVELSPLGPDEVRSLIRCVLGRSPPPALEAAVIERSGGNPLFVKEMVRSLVDAEPVAGPSLLSVLDRLPLTIEGVLSARIDRLPPAAATVLQVASVIGRRVPVALLQAVVGDPAALDQSVTRLVAAGFLDDDPAVPGQMVFHHALMVDAAYNRLLRRNRRKLHLRVAEVAERLYGVTDEHVALLARHLYLAGAGERALDYLLRAADVARRLFANEEAILHLRRAAEVAAPLADRRPQVHLDLADLLELRGDYDEAYELYAGVRSTDPACAWRGMASVRRKQGRIDDALAVLGDARCAVPESAPARGLLELERGRILLVGGRFGEAVRALEGALAELDEDSTDAGHALLHLARAELVVGQADSALDHANRALAIHERHEDLRGVTVAMRILGGVYEDLGRLDEASTSLRRGQFLAERLGDVEELGGCLLNLGLVELKRGALEVAIACDRRAIEEFERIDHASGRATGYANLAEKLAAAGDYEEAGRWCRRSLEIARVLDDVLQIADARRTLSTILLGQGHPAAAAVEAESAAHIFEEIGAVSDAAVLLEKAADARARAGNPASSGGGSTT